jgi:bifunctional DNase/RNase
MTIVRIAHAERWPGKAGEGRFPGHGVLAVLADDAGHRALPVWLEREPGGRSLVELADRPEKEIVTAATPEDLAARLLRAAGASVAGVDIDATVAGAEVLTPRIANTRVELAGPAGTQHVAARLGLALALAAAAGAPVRVAEGIMDRLAVPVTGDDLLSQFLDRLPPASGPPPADAPGGWPVVGPPGRLPRFEPRNLAFADGLDRWDLDGSFLREGDGPSGRDYAAAAGSGSALLRSALPHPRGSAALVQTIFADDYRGAAVVFRGEIRTDGVTGEAGLRLEILRPAKPFVGRREDHGITLAGSRDWAPHEIRAVIPEDANVIRFGIVLAGPGRVALRAPELEREA